MKILVIGGTGVLGSKFVESLSKDSDVYYTFVSVPRDLGFGKPQKLDISDRLEVSQIFRKVVPDLVIHAGGIIDVKKCEEDKVLADAVNVEGTRNLADMCRQTGAKLVYISTSAVFNGSKDLYKEDDPISPVNYHGYTKAKSEEIVRETCDDHMIIRTNQVYCWVRPWQKKNLVTIAIERFSKGNIWKDVTDWFDTPTLAENLVEVVCSLIEKSKTGTYHVNGPDYVSRYEWAVRVARVFGYDERLAVPISSTAINLKLNRPSVHMSNEKASVDSGIRILGLEEGLEFMKKQIH